MTMKKKVELNDDIFDYELPMPEETMGELSPFWPDMFGEEKEEQEKDPAERGEDLRISMSFMSDPISVVWNWSDLDYANSNDAPNFNLTVMALILSTNIECMIGEHSWSLVESSLSKLGFINIVHHHFDDAEDISCVAMVFARSKEPVHGKYVVAAVYRGTTSMSDVISDVKSQLVDGFYEAGMVSVSMLSEYIDSQKLTKENTTLFITGHSYGAANASLVGVMSTDLAERDSIFCYPFAAPNYDRDGRTGKGMKMFTFDSVEDIVPQVPVGPNLDKAGVEIIYDRLDMQLNQPEEYQRFLRVYKYFRHRDYEEDFDFIPEVFTIHRDEKIESDSEIFRHHMTYIYMALILSEQPDDVIDSYIGKAADSGMRIEMYAGEVYRMPIKEEFKNITWKSSDKSVATLNKKGMLAAKGAGKAQLTATLKDGKTATLEVTVLED
jgi:hypothetical protein